MATQPAIFKWRHQRPRTRTQLYRAIDSAGATIVFLLSALRDADAAKRLFRKALSDRSHPQPRVINTDLTPIYGAAIAQARWPATLDRIRKGRRFFRL